MSIKIPVHIYTTRDHYNDTTCTYFAIDPVEPLPPPSPETLRNAPYPQVVISRSESKLIGYIVAPDDTRTITSSNDKVDVVMMGGANPALALNLALVYAQHKWDGLAWEPAAMQA